MHTGQVPGSSEPLPSQCIGQIYAEVYSGLVFSDAEELSFVNVQELKEVPISKEALNMIKKEVFILG
ncbi:MAG: hypothetical protein HKN39_02345 [Flavobacteriales bacterium]|nr:hypothetical protein [Flavobacteriales bacterium]